MGFAVEAGAGMNSKGLHRATGGRATRKKPVIGIAGGIGAGKTQVARLLEALGAAVIDSDELVHEELRDQEVVATLRQWWGDRILTPDGEVDRGAVGAVVFGDAAQLGRLERLLYPRVERRRRELMEAYTEDARVRAIVIDAPKLFEAGVDKVCDVVVFVDADQQTRQRRVADSRGWTEEELARRENLQNPLDLKRANADYVVTNNSGIEELRVQVQQVFSSLLASGA
jgi:dephospho-CoA kinase